jgi:hypothetical protein
MHANRLSPGILAAFIVLATILAAVLSFIIPVDPSVHNITYAHWRMAISSSMAIATAGSSLLFLRGLTGFTAELRRTYMLFSVAIILFSVAVLQIPVLALHEWWSSWYANSGLIIVPFITSTVATYISMRRFAQLCKVPSKLLSRTFANGAALTIGVTCGILAHFLVLYTLEGTDVYVAVTAFTSAYITWAAILAVLISGVIGHHYRRAIGSLSIALMALSISGWHETIRVFFVNDGAWYVDSGLYLLPFVISGFLLVRAGYVFSRLQIVAPQRGVVSHTDNDEKSAYLDAVRWAASLVSRPEDIESVIDIMRITTARIDPNTKTLTAGQKDQLLHIYETLEEYLVRQDPIKLHSREEVRGQLQPSFRAELEAMQKRGDGQS